MKRSLFPIPRSMKKGDVLILDKSQNDFLLPGYEGWINVVVVGGGGGSYPASDGSYYGAGGGGAGFSTNHSGKFGNGHDGVVIFIYLQCCVFRNIRPCPALLLQKKCLILRYRLFYLKSIYHGL